MANAGRTLASITIGAGLGLVIGYLTAPRSGKDTITKYQGELERTKRSLESSAQTKIAETKGAINNGIEKQLDKGIEGLGSLKTKLKI